MSFFLGLSDVEVAARVQAAMDAVASGCVVRVGAELHGHRNVGVDLPRARRSALESRQLQRRLRDALEAAHVVMAPNALAPHVGRDLRGQVQTGDGRVG